MKLFRLGPAIAITLLISICGAADHKRASSPVDHSWDIAIMDRALAKANPHDRWVKFGDVGIRYTDLKAYRDRLAGLDRQAHAPPGSAPFVVTPAPTPAFTWPAGNVNYRFDPIGLTNGTVFTMTPAGAITTLHTFTGSDGGNPVGALVRATDGNFYGTTQLGGPSNNGTVFKITSTGTFTTLHTFSGSDGANPSAALIQAADGNFYGTTQIGGANNIGTVFKITSGGTLTTLYSFGTVANDGMNPVAPLVQGRSPDTNFYGTTQYGGNGLGTVFKITPAGTLTTLYSFGTAANDGINPVAGLIQGAAPDTNFYGTTQYGGTNGAGTVFKITSAGAFNSIHSFDFNDGYQPVAGLIQGVSPDTNFYGTTQFGGASNQGTVFKITSAGTVTTLRSFVLNDGQQPVASLVQAAAPDGNFYGTVFRGGANADGTTFKISSTGTFTPLHTFIGTDGVEPMAGLVQGSGADTNFYGTTPGNNTINALKMQQFRDGVAEWEAFANLHFIEFTTGAAPTNFITVQQKPPGTGEGGFSSSVGIAGGEQFIQCGAQSWNRGTVCHEVGHALGLWHEQQRPDRDTYVTVNTGNIISGLEPNFSIIPGGQTFSTPYDFYSVMHYTRNTFAINPNQDTISMKPGFTQYADIIGNVNDRTLSKVERAGMAIVYGAPFPTPAPFVTNTKDSGPGSLRTAIYFAFDKSPDSSPAPSPSPAPTPPTITFSIPTNDPGYNSGTGLYTIKPTAPLPALGKGTTINGNAQIVLDGSNFALLQGPFGLYSPGLILRAANCTIQGLTIINFNQWGIRIYQGTDPNGSAATGNIIGGTTAAARNVISGNAFYGIAIHDSTTTGNIIEGNYIGTNRAGSAAQANAIAGVVIYLGAHGNTIGGTTSGAGNVISGNTNQGVFIGDAGSNSNLIQGNYIGTDSTGGGTVPNGSGIEITAGAQSNIIGGTSPAARNVISGNAGVGIAIDEFNDLTAIGTRNNIIQGNFIGLNAAGNTGVANQGDGISIFGGAPSNIIGGTATGAGNVISGNQFSGISILDPGTNNTVVQGNIIGLNAAGTGKIQNGGDGVALFGGAQSTTIGGTTAAARNVISGNQFSGVSIGLNNTNNNLVQGNYIGVDITGSTVLGNGGDGVALYGDGPAPSPSPTAPPNTGPQSNIIGGTVAGARNIISGNGGNGVSIGNPGTSGTDNNLVQGNYIGVDFNGLAPKGNGFAGVLLYGGAHSNTIGGTLAGARNVISANGGQGVAIGGLGSPGLTTGPTQNVVAGNYIGIDAAGAAGSPAPVGNSSVGVNVYTGAQSNTVGGTSAGARNIISGNVFRDVEISGTNANANIVAGNFIGLDATGAGTIPSNSNTSGAAIFGGAQNNIIGGTVGGSRNFICGHAQYGIFISDAGTTGNLVQGNTIGLNAVGAAAPNTFPAVAFFNGSQSNTLGGSAVGASNIIAGNTNEGVALYDATTIKNKISQNSIFSNHIRGITLNTSSNNNQAAPVLSSADLGSTSVGGTEVKGSLTSAPSTTFRIEFFASPAGNDEGQFFIGSANVMTDSGGSFLFNNPPTNPAISLPAAVPSGYVITATSTDPNGNTSQFSNVASIPSPSANDSDSDGMPNSYETAHSFNPANSADAGMDTDGDGMTNLQEYKAGTDPRNATSVFRISSIVSSSGMQINFSSVSGKTYRLEYRDDLVAGNWVPLVDGIFGTGGTLQILDPGSAGLTKRFYRVSIEP